MNIDNLPNFWLAMHGCAEAGPASFPRHVLVAETLLRKSTVSHFRDGPCPRHGLVMPGFLQKTTGGTFWARGFQGALRSRGVQPPRHDQNRPKRDQSVPPQEAKRLKSVTARISVKTRCLSVKPARNPPDFRQKPARNFSKLGTQTLSNFNKPLNPYPSTLSPRP